MKLLLGRPKTNEGRLPKEIRVYDLLDSLNIEYYRIDHSPANHFEECEEIEKVLDNVLCKKNGGEINALMRTTVAFTQMEGSSAPNVIPPKAAMVSNMRLNPMDNIDSAMAYLKKTVNDDTVEIKLLHGMNPSRISTTDCEGYNKVATAVASTWRGCIVSPYLMVQCSDSRHWGKISDKVYRFSAMDLTSEERATIHGNNEKIRIETLHKAVEFYIRLMSEC